MRTARFAFLPAALFSVACSGGHRDGSPVGGAEPNAPPTAPDGSRSPSDGIEPGSDNGASKRNVCETIDYGIERPNADYFLTFPDDDAAIAYSRDFLTTNNMPPASEISHDERIVGLLDTVYAGYRKVFPRETEGFDKAPRIVIVTQQGVNAFAGFDDRPEIQKGPWLIYVHNATLQHPKSEEIAGLFAHELAHLVLRNILPETRARIRTHYRVPGGAEKGILAAGTNDDPVARDRIEEIRTIGTKAGRHSNFGSMPLSPFAEPEYYGLIKTLEASGVQPADPSACKTADDGIKQMQGIYQPAASIHDYTLHVTAEQNDKLTELGRTAGDALEKCYGNVTQSLFELKAKGRVAKLPAAESGAALARLLDPNTAEHKTAEEQLMTSDVERSVDANRDMPTGDRLVTVVDTLHRRLADLEKDASLPIDELRMYDMEEDADDAAVRVLLASGTDPLANARLFVNMMPDPAACFADVENGKVPAYGRFIDPHNNTCWRWFHATQFANVIAQCRTQGLPSTRPTTSTSRTVATSPADLSPSRLLERGFQVRLLDISAIRAP